MRGDSSEKREQRGETRGVKKQREERTANRGEWRYERIDESKEKR